MKTSSIFLIAVLMAAAGLLLHEAGAQGQGPSCYLTGSTGKTFFFVRELDQDGNPLGQLGSGWVNPGEQMPIISQTGNISINYRLSSSDKMVMMDPTNCSDGAVISVP
jgi:hypothetical protein